MGRGLKAQGEEEQPAQGIHLTLPPEKSLTVKLVSDLLLPRQREPHQIQGQVFDLRCTFTSNVSYIPPASRPRTQHVLCETVHVGGFDQYNHLLKHTFSASTGGKTTSWLPATTVHLFLLKCNLNQRDGKRLRNVTLGSPVH